MFCTFINSNLDERHESCSVFMLEVNPFSVFELHAVVVEIPHAFMLLQCLFLGCKGFFRQKCHFSSVKKWKFSKFRQISSKINIFVTTASFRYFVSFLSKNEILWAYLLPIHMSSHSSFYQWWCHLHCRPRRWFNTSLLRSWSTQLWHLTFYFFSTFFFFSFSSFNSISFRRSVAEATKALG